MNTEENEKFIRFIVTAPIRKDDDEHGVYWKLARCICHAD